MIDLTTFPRLHSIFEENTRVRREGIQFLREFLGDFRKPVKKDSRESPSSTFSTQVVAEYDGPIALSARQTRPKRSG